MSSKRLQRGTTPLKVVDLGEYRRRRGVSARATVFYVNQANDWLELLHSYQSLSIQAAKSEQELRRLMATNYPDVILVESWLQWTEANELVSQLNEVYQVPIIMTFKGETGSTETRNSIKRAYAAGVSDTLLTPLNREELSETLEVLLKFQKQQSLYH